MSWPVVKLGNAVESIMGQAPPGSECNKTGEGTIFVKAGEFGKEFPVIKEWTTKPLRYAKKGDTLLCVVGATCGKVNKAIDCAIGRSVAAIRPIKDKIDENYLFYFVSSWSSKLRNMSQGAAQTVINKDMIANLEIPLPPLDEQKRIAAILDKADAIRRKRQQAIQLADDFLRSVFLNMFGDPVTNPKGYPVNKLGTNCEDLFLGLTSKVDYVDGDNGYPLIRAKDINKGELSFNEVKYISETQHQKLTKNHLTRKGDLLVSKSGTLGTCAIVRTEREFSTYESIFTVRPDVTKINLHYLIHLLQNRGFKEKLIGNKVGGTVAHLNLKMFRDFEIGIPPLEIQNEFSVKIIKCEEKIEKYRQSAIEANLFFNSLSQKAFAGEL